jgi:hypothetical protein
MKTNESDTRSAVALVATLLWKKPDFLVAICREGFLYWYPWNGKGHFTTVPEGALVNVHYYEGFRDEVLCFEDLA